MPGRIQAAWSTARSRFQRATRATAIVAPKKITAGIAYIASTIARWVLRNGSSVPVSGGAHDGFEHRNIVHFIAAGQRERPARGRRFCEMLELGALGAGLREVAQLRSLLLVRVGRVHEAGLQVPGVQVL